MSGILFLKTVDLKKTKDFYVREIGMTIWLEQKNISLLKHGNLILGMHETGEVERFGLITFFYPTREEVDGMYKKLRDRAVHAPRVNDQYNIYHFFAEDPEGRKLEFQAFLHPLEPYMDGQEALLTRRSVRTFREKEIPEEILWKTFEMCRYSPTSRNSESYYFLAIRDREKMDFLASLRGASSAPISKAPLAVATCADPGKTSSPDQDGTIAAYHFVLAAWLMGLGTCWIAAMDKEEAKECLSIPKDHYIATITPLGYPSEFKSLPNRRSAKELWGRTTPNS